MPAQHQERRSLVSYAFALACLAALTVGLAMAWFDDGLTARAIMSAVGLNLVASVIFAVIFTLLSQRIQERSLDATLKEGLAEFSTNVTAELAKGRREYLPQALYPPVEPAGGSYGDRFNIDMTRSLEQTGSYAFRGPSARYVAARLRRSSHYPHQVTVAMLSPGDSRAVARRAADRRHWTRFAGQTAEELEEGLRRELVLSVVSLFDYRRYCPINLLYTEDTAVYRYEMFDDSVYISWYHGDSSEAREMPETIRFGRESFMYRTLQLDLWRRFDISSSTVTFTATHDDEDLKTHLGSVIGRPVTDADLRRWRAEYETYVHDFTLYLDTVYEHVDRLRP
ncbi:hypothetical protein Q5762_24435 [Streptomyces sp. P9(2023)]|uniref:hypothetical protein n=1 Tax=Streptomyces sp. P9(2023) TaxID=3064394 RepID=UPI0028F41184|nr:hypothetical protein [Streptomyces sp. P9(2023)]MDT9691434.1 hypothetical protein [Streptomyces sp. P9(2023)]